MTTIKSGVALSKEVFVILSSQELKSIETFAIKAHQDTNHYYDEYLPYEFHLRMVVKAAKDFIYLIPVDKIYTVIASCFCHDSVEDARQNFNSIKKVTNIDVAEIVRAVTNYGRGRDRSERMPDFCYEDIRQVPYATFVKLCDRIANVQYSKMTGSSMFEKYKKEHEHFKYQLNQIKGNEPMWDYLDELFNTKNNNMGAAWDAMCKNEDLNSTLSKRNKTIREQKKLITELAEGIVKYMDGDRDYDVKEYNVFYEKAQKILDKQNKKK